MICFVNLDTSSSNLIFIQTFVVSLQMICVYTINNSVNFEVKAALDLLNNLQKKLKYQSQWSPFYLSVEKCSGNNFSYKFMSKNLKEKEM